MANDGKPPGNRSRHLAPVPHKAAIERPFDKWLQKQLHAMYDEIASEPLPEDLLNLIERDARNKTVPARASGRKSEPSGEK
jgi:hypothetical protein